MYRAWAGNVFYFVCFSRWFIYLYSGFVSLPTIVNLCKILQCNRIKKIDSIDYHIVLVKYFTIL